MKVAGSNVLMSDLQGKNPASRIYSDGPRPTLPNLITSYRSASIITTSGQLVPRNPNRWFRFWRIGIQKKSCSITGLIFGGQFFWWFLFWKKTALILPKEDLDQVTTEFRNYDRSYFWSLAALWTPGDSENGSKSLPLARILKGG